MNEKDISSVSNILELVKGCNNWDDTTLVEFQRKCNGCHLCSKCQLKISSEKKRISDLIKKNEDFLEFLEQYKFNDFRIDLDYENIKNKISSLQEELRKLKQAEEVA